MRLPVATFNRCSASFFLITILSYSNNLNLLHSLLPTVVHFYTTGSLTLSDDFMSHQCQTVVEKRDFVCVWTNYMFRMTKTSPGVAVWSSSEITSGFSRLSYRF